MFVPPPSEESLLIVRKSASKPWLRAASTSFAVTLGGIGAAFFLIFQSAPSGEQGRGFIVEALDPDSFKVYQATAIEISAKDIKSVMELLDAREAQIAKENDAVLRSRRPVAEAPRGSNSRELDRLASVVPSPTLRVPPPAQKTPSSGEWLGGDVLLKESGLARIDQSVAVFIQGQQRVDFRVGSVLPNGEVVLQVDPANLSVRTDRRFIRIIDDGS